MDMDILHANPDELMADLNSAHQTVRDLIDQRQIDVVRLFDALAALMHARARMERWQQAQEQLAAEIDARNPNH